ARLSAGIARWGHYDVNLATDSEVPKREWSDWYKLISSANSIIVYIQESGLTESERGLVEAEARFFRGFAYRHLVHLFGGVPIITDQIDSPKTDFIRNSSEEVLNQIIND